MNYILSIFIILLSGSTFAQSKKELRAQLAAKQATIDSLQLVTIKEENRSDSLAKLFTQAQNNFTNLARVNGDLTNDYNRCLQRTNALERENADLRQKLTETKSPPTKTNKTTTTKPKVKATTEYDDNPFGPGGSGKGDGNDLGNDSGSGSGVNRYLIQMPNVSEIVSEENCTLVFTVVVNGDGEIVGYPAWDRTNSTSEDATLIKQVSAAIKSQAKYNKNLTSGNVKKIIKVNIRAK